MAHKKAAGSAKNLKDSNPKYRGLKLAGGQFARAGNIIIRQKGDKYVCGENVYKGKDFTVHATIDGIVVFSKKNVRRFDGRVYLKTVVSVLPQGDHTAATQAEKVSTKKVEKKVEKKVVEAKVEKKAPAKKAADTTDSAGDDLTKIEGIGPVIAEHLATGGIKTFADLSSSKIDDLRTILADNGLSNHDPKTWKKQATLAKNEKWDELKALQDELIGGK